VLKNSGRMSIALSFTKGSKGIEDSDISRSDAIV